MIVKLPAYDIPSAGFVNPVAVYWERKLKGNGLRGAKTGIAIEKLQKGTCEQAAPDQQNQRKCNFGDDQPVTKLALLLPK